jgi:DNA (cytosine-5)-methyltransferase 1
MSQKNAKLRVAELFAGVGGFHLGLKKAGGYDVVWANQWEPSTKKQHAFEVYADKFTESVNDFSNTDIAKVPTKNIPDHDLLVGGFPCQDYSVARTLSHAAGLNGKKGVLWWQIERILREKKAKAPKFLMLENVDRLLKSPVTQRGRDFAVMLSSLANLGYTVEWRVINAADYGMPQRRRRIYIMGYKKGTAPYMRIGKLEKAELWALREGVMAKAFPIQKETACELAHIELSPKLEEISENFNRLTFSETPFGDTGVMMGHKVRTWKTKPLYKGKFTTLADIIEDEKKIPDEYFIKDSTLRLWKTLKGGKTEPRTTKGGHNYNYTEGPVAFPDPLTKPARTIVTGEGGSTPSRFKHVIQTKSGRLRRLMPIELERANMFPDNHTEDATDGKRAFFMGNALVVGVVQKLGISLWRLLRNS